MGYSGPLKTNEYVWHRRFLRVAREVASWSKDPSTKVGSVAVLDNRIIATGYNGFPKAIPDISDRLHDRELKYKFMVHAEENMLKESADFRGATAYIYGLAPCSKCLLSLVNHGFVNVYYVKVKERENWEKDWYDNCEDIIEVSGIKVEELKKDEIS